MESIRVLIVDDHVVVRKGIQMIINTEPDITVAGEAEDGDAALSQVARLRPDIVLMDLVMPNKNGIEAVTEIKRAYPEVKVIVLTTYEDDTLINASMEAGADGYLLKNADGEALLQAIRFSYAGAMMPLDPAVAHRLFKEPPTSPATHNAGLTRREKEVLELVAQGLSNRDVAHNLSLSSGTVKLHVSHILGKLNVSSRTEAAVLATQMGLVPGNGHSKKVEL